MSELMSDSVKLPRRSRRRTEDELAAVLTAFASEAAASKAEELDDAAILTVEACEIDVNENSERQRRQERIFDSTRLLLEL